MPTRKINLSLFFFDKRGMLYYCCLAEVRYMQKTLTIRIPDDIRDDLEELSRAEHIPVSALVRESIKKYVAIQRFRSIRNKVLPFAEAQGLLTDDDIFKTLL